MIEQEMTVLIRDVVKVGGFSDLVLGKRSSSEIDVGMQWRATRA